MGTRDRWWRENFASRPYATGHNYEDFRLAYQYGYEAGTHHMGRTWDDVESDLRTGWDSRQPTGPDRKTARRQFPAQVRMLRLGRTHLAARIR